jgi:hypothetical protein
MPKERYMVHVAPICTGSGKDLTTLRLMYATFFCIFVRVCFQNYASPHGHKVTALLVCMSSLTSWLQLPAVVGHEGPTTIAAKPTVINCAICPCRNQCFMWCCYPYTSLCHQTRRVAWIGDTLFICSARMVHWCSPASLLGQQRGP